MVNVTNATSAAIATTTNNNNSIIHRFTCFFSTPIGNYMVNQKI